MFGKKKQMSVEKEFEKTKDLDIKSFLWKSKREIMELLKGNPDDS